MIFDLKTQEAYGFVLYQDATDVVLLSPHGESQMSADQFAELVTLQEESGLAWATLARYQVVDVEGEEAQHPSLRVRRGELARYAAANGGQVHTHIEPPSRLQKARDRLKEVFRPH